MLVWGLPASDQITECTKGKGTAMKQQFLHENWEMRQIGNDEFLPAAVPVILKNVWMIETTGQQPYPEAYTATCFPTEKWKIRSGKTMKTMPAS